jgi:hypothetical protein
MSYLSKLTVKAVKRTNVQDPTHQRRRKLVAGIEEQLEVAVAALDGKDYEVKKSGWAKNEQGQKVAVERLRKVRPCFFEQDGGWYVQCKYGSRALELGNGNAVFVKTLVEVEGALSALKAAANAGELDEAVKSIVGTHTLKGDAGKRGAEKGTA